MIPSEAECKALVTAVFDDGYSRGYAAGLRLRWALAVVATGLVLCAALLGRW
jgi:hypothetical protein